MADDQAYCARCGAACPAQPRHDAPDEAPRAIGGAGYGGAGYGGARQAMGGGYAGGTFGGAAGTPGYGGAPAGAAGYGDPAAGARGDAGYGPVPFAPAAGSETLERIQRALDEASGPLQGIADRVLGVYPADPVRDLPLKWYTFNVTFALWLEALFGAWCGITAVLGQQYGGLTDLYYSFMGETRVLDIVYGLVQIGLAVATVYVRHELAHRRRFAPLHFMALYVLSFALSTVYSIVLASAIGFGLGGLSLIPTVISAALGFLFLHLNKKYFDRRAYLFYR